MAELGVAESQNYGEGGQLDLRGVALALVAAVCWGGSTVLLREGLIEEAVRVVFAGESLNHMAKRTLTACGQSCIGSGMGCG